MHTNHRRAIINPAATKMCTQRQVNVQAISIFTVSKTTTSLGRTFVQWLLHKRYLQCITFHCVAFSL